MNDEEKEVAFVLAAIFIGVMIARILFDVALMVSEPRERIIIAPARQMPVGYYPAKHLKNDDDEN